MVSPSAGPEARLGRYDIVGPLATGGMAEILLGKLRGPSGFERAVVVKRILPHYAAQREFVSMFLDEGRIVARLSHPNVVQVHELAEEGGELFLVMEYLQGESLAGLMRRAKLRGHHLDPALAAFIVAEAAAGLHAAHELKAENGTPMGLVHRDVSPQNVFVTYHGVVKILDFGIAKAADRITQTEAGALKGKYEYMSPQQALGEAIDRRSDVFALGIVLYELLTEARLFRRSSPLATLRAVTDDPIVPPSEVRADCPQELERICLKALSREVDGRYASAADMRRDLLAFSRKAGADVPAEALADVLTTLFGERARAKEELLENLARGAPLGAIPDANVDAAVELPEVVSISTRASPVRRRQPERPGARWALFASLPLIALGGAAAWYAQRDIVEATPPRIEGRPGVIVHEPPAAPPSPEPLATEISVALESDPAGARVLVDGELRGTTPMSLGVARGDEPVALTVSLDGFVPVERSLVPDVDQRIVVSLLPARGRARRRPEPPDTTGSTTRTDPAEPTGEPTPGPGERRFRRFD